MSSPATLPLSSIVDVVVNVAPAVPAQPTFNQGLIVGPSTRISSTIRVKQYQTLAQMTADGFLNTDPEYIAAELYFAASPAPLVVLIGCHVAGNESVLQAIQACQQKNPAFWGVYATDATKSDHEAVGAWAQANVPAVMYFYNTSDSDVPLGTVGNVAQALKALLIDRAAGLYATTGAGLYPNNQYIGAALMGVTMGLNTGLANSYFTDKFKTLPLAGVEPLGPSVIGIIEGENCNLYLSYANLFSFVEQGVVASGKFIDEILNLDMLVSDIQFSIMDLLTGNPSIPQTDAGQTLLLQVVTQACERARVRGFVAGNSRGWEGPTVLNLNTGDPVPNGYVVMSPKYSTQSAANRAARKAVPIFVCITEAGAVHSIVVQVNVQR